MLVVVDNSKDVAVCTPKLIELVATLVRSDCDVVVVKTLQHARELVKAHKGHVEGIIFGGGPLLLSGAVKLKNYSKNVLLAVGLQHVPQLHICFGAQVLASLYGGIVDLMSSENEGWKQCVRTTRRSRIMSDIPTRFSCFVAHHDAITLVPVGFEVVARGPHDEIQALELDDPEHNRYFAAVQFHPEASTGAGQQVLVNFLTICGVSV